MAPQVAVFPSSDLETQIAISRIVEPYGRLVAAGTARVRFFRLPLSAADVRWIRAASAIVLQRDLFPFLAALLARLASEAEIPLVYEIDDLLHRPPPGHPDLVHLRSKREHLRWLLGRADGVVVSTRPLLSRPSLLRYALPRAVCPPADRVRIGYAGTPSHLPDLEIVREACLRTDEEFAGRIEWCFYGCVPAWAKRLGRVRTIPPSPDRSSFFRRWAADPFEIGLAPLRRTAFNEVKDLTKFYDYAHHGAAGIYSAVAPYRGCIRSGLDGLLVPASTRAWWEAIRALVIGKERRRRIVAASRARVRDEALRRRRDLPRRMARFLGSLRPRRGAENLLQGGTAVAVYGAGEAGRARRFADRVAIASFTHYASIRARLEAQGWRYGRDFL